MHEAPRLGRGDGSEAGGQAVQRSYRGAGRPAPHQVLITAPRAVIFDFGGVIWNMGWDSARDLEAALRERLTNVVGVVDLFDDIVCSAEVGLAKPEPAIYALACDRLGVPPGACVFVDDHEANVDAATGAGLRAILYRVDRGDDLRAQLATAGVAVARS